MVSILLLRCYGKFNFLRLSSNLQAVLSTKRIFYSEKSIEFYADRNDLIILISVGGKSQNMINGFKISNKKKLKIITLTGHNINNFLKRNSTVNLHVNSKAYNYVENIFQVWLLSIVDLIIGKSEYKV